MFITSAYAQGAGQAAAGAGDLLIPMIPIVLVLLVFYLFVFRPMDQQKKSQDALLSSMKKGDEVVTTGGLIGKVQSLEENEIVLELSENARVRVLRSAIASFYGQPAPEAPPQKGGFGQMGNDNGGAGG